MNPERLYVFTPETQFTSSDTINSTPIVSFRISGGLHPAAVALVVYVVLLMPASYGELRAEGTENLARWHAGASLILVRGNAFQRIGMSEVGDFDESVLLSDNSALSHTIEIGDQAYIIDLGREADISRFFLSNLSASGSFKLLANDGLEPIDSPSWTPLAKEILFNEGVLPSVNFPEARARYLLIRFKIEKEGIIGNLGITGPAPDRSVSQDIDRTPEETPEDPVAAISETVE